MKFQGGGQPEALSEHWVVRFADGDREVDSTELFDRLIAGEISAATPVRSVASGSRFRELRAVPGLAECAAGVIALYCNCLKYMLVCFPSLLLIALGRFGLTLVDCGSFRLYEPQGMILAVLYAWLGFLGMMQVCNLFCYGRTNVEPVRMMMLLIPYWNLWDGPRYFRERIVGLRAQLRIWEWRVLSAGNVCIGVFAALFTLSLWIAPAEILSGVCFAGLVLSMTGSWLGLCPLLIRKLRRLKQKNPLPKPPRGVFLRLPEPLRTARRWGKQQLGGSWREAGIGLLIGLAALLVGFGPPWLANEYRWREVVREHPQLRLTRQQQLSTPLPPGPYASSAVKATDVPEHEHEERAAENRDYAMRFTGSIDPEFRKRAEASYLRYTPVFERLDRKLREFPAWGFPVENNGEGRTKQDVAYALVRFTGFFREKDRIARRNGEAVDWNRTRERFDRFRGYLRENDEEVQHYSYLIDLSRMRGLEEQARDLDAENLRQEIAYFREEEKEVAELFARELAWRYAGSEALEWGGAVQRPFIRMRKFRPVQRAIRLAGKDFSEVREAVEQYAKEFDGTWKQLLLQAPGSRDIVTVSRHRLVCRLGYAGAALELYRRRYGGYPDSLRQLVPEFLPEVPSDPFDGEPLRYRAGIVEISRSDIHREGGRFVKVNRTVAEPGARLYSIGPDLTDDGGRDWNAAGSDSCDLSFTLSAAGEVLRAKSSSSSKAGVSPDGGRLVIQYPVR